MKTLLLHPVYLIGMAFTLGLMVDYMMTRPPKERRGILHDVLWQVLSNILLLAILLIWPFALGLFVSRKLR